MLKLLKEDGPNGVPIVLLGLAHKNLDRLRAAEPIHLDIDQCAMLGLGQRELVIFAGKDEATMTAELEQHGLVPEGSTEKITKTTE